MRPTPSAPCVPPRLWRALLTWTLPAGTEGLTVEGDLLEEFRDRAAAGGLRLARRWYRRQALALSWHYARNPNRASSLERARQLLREAVRALVRTPGSTLAAVGSLALAIGAAAAIAAIVSTVLLRPLPYADPDRLAMIWDVQTERNLTRQLLSPPTVLDYRRIQVFADIAAWWRPDATLRDAGLEPRRAKVVEATGNFFTVLGVRPAIGPGFPADDPLHSTDRLVVLSDALWRDRYAADPAVVGRTLTLNADIYRIAGVMPAGFAFPDAVDLWTRLAWDPAPLGRGIHIFEGIARLGPGVSLAEASRELAALTARLGREHPDTNAHWSATPTWLLDEVLGFYRPALLVMLGAVGLLLIVACLNVSGLLLARGAGRAREIAVRTALGASRGRVVLQLLAESALLAAVSAVLGSVAGLVLLRSALPWLPVSVPRLTTVAPDATVVLFLCGVTAAAAIIFGLMPALSATRGSAAQTLAAGARGSTAAVGRGSRALVVTEIALACVVLVSAGVLMRSVQRMTDAAPGVSADGVLTVELQPDGPAYEDWRRTAAFHSRVVDALAAMPGIDAAGSTNTLPLQSTYRMRYARPDRPATPDAPVAPVQHISVDAGYFEAVRARLVSGRGFTPRDTLTAEPVLVLNQTMARIAFGDEDPVGRTLVPAAVSIGPFGYNLPGRVAFRVVGVIADIQQTGLQKPNEPAMYFTVRQFPARTMYITTRGPGASLEAVKAAVRSVDPSVPAGKAQLLQDWLLGHSAAARLLMMVLAGFGFVMAVTAGAGLFALLSWTVTRQLRDLAIRQALGATPGRLAAQLARHAIGLAGLGVIIGLVLARLTASTLSAFLFRTTIGDPAVTLGTVAVVVLATVAALAAPARRVRRVDAVKMLS